jgi:hypothetical protein
MISSIAEDFNCPCQHEHMVVALRYDDWGMLIRYPFESYHILSLESDEEGYNKFVRPITKKLLEERPVLANEFCTRVLEQHDDQYWLFFYEQVLKIPDLDQAIHNEHSGSATYGVIESVQDLN